MAWLGETTYETGVTGVVISSGSMGLPIFVRKLRGLPYQDKRKLSTTRVASRGMEDKGIVGIQKVRN